MIISDALLEKFGACKDGRDFGALFQKQCGYDVDVNTWSQCVFEAKKHYAQNHRDFSDEIREEIYDPTNTRTRWNFDDKGHWQEMFTFFDHLAQNPRAIIAGGNAVLGEKWKIVTYAYFDVFDSREEAEQAIQDYYETVRDDPIHFFKIHYWKTVPNGMTNVNISSWDEVPENTPVQIFQPEEGVYTEDLSVEQAKEKLHTLKLDVMDKIKNHSYVQESVRDCVDHFFTWNREYPYVVT